MEFFALYPGLVGGHCIGVDPYYLTHRAERAGYHPEVILSGRRINDGVGLRVARECVRLLARNGGGKNVTVLGLTFKENVPDIRNSKVVDLIRELESFGCSVQIHDPLALPNEANHEYGLRLVPITSLKPADAVVLAVAHADYVKDGWPFVTGLLNQRRGVVLDVTLRLDRATKPDGVELWRL
jgi:UDP-N-acetyl-D-galactosamine dehydrogenase